MRKITALIYIAVAWTPTGATTSHRQHISAQDEIVVWPLRKKYPSSLNSPFLNLGPHLVCNFASHASFLSSSLLQIDPPKPADDATLESTNRTDVHCDIATEETCYSHDGNYTPEYCAKLSDGGCPCASGEVKCGYGRYSSGYCTAVCCDPRTEETCYDGKLRPVECKRFGEGGCGCSKTKKKKNEKERTQVRCGFSETDPGYCADVCCDEITEETCVGDDGELYCAKYSDGGCPCEDEDDVKCGYSENFPGYCTKVCAKNQQLHMIFTSIFFAFAE